MHHSRSWQIQNKYRCYGLRGIYGRFDSKIRFEIESDGRFDSRFNSNAKNTIRRSLDSRIYPRVHDSPPEPIRDCACAEECAWWFTDWHPLCENMMSSTKLEVDNIRHCPQRRTKPRLQVMYRRFHEVWVCFWDVRVDRQTVTRWLQYFASVLGGILHFIYRDGHQVFDLVKCIEKSILRR